MAASLVGLGLLWAGAQAMAQEAMLPAVVEPSAAVSAQDTGRAMEPSATQTPPLLPAISRQPVAAEVPTPPVEQVPDVAPAVQTMPMNPPSAPRPPAPSMLPGGSHGQFEESEQARPGMGGEREGGYQIQLEPPGPERLFTLESESQMQERWRQQERQATPPERIEFPQEPVISTQKYTPRAFPPHTEFVEPNYVCYGRLYFEEKNAERYGWDLGIIQPFVSAGIFYFDVITLPYNCGTDPCRKYECSAGYCLPGDPVPLLLYPPQLSLTGAVLEAGTIVALYAIFPG